MSENKLTAFLTEVLEQPKALNDLITFYSNEGKTRLKTWAALAKTAGRVVFSGMGTSEFAPEMVIGQMAGDGVDATFIDAGELLHYPRPIRGLLVPISQSGESAEVRELAVRSADKKNRVAITNNTESTLARNAGLVLPLLAGQETAISTKTYINTLAVLYLMAQSLRDQFPLDRLKKVADTLPQIDADGIEPAAKLLADTRALHFIGRGPTMAAVRQCALTFMEGTRISATAFTGGTFRHGPFELVDDTHRCVFFMPGGKTFDLLKKMVLEVAGQGSHVVAITDQPLELPGSNCRVLKVPGHGEELFSLSAATTQERLLEAVARARGITAGIFRYGQKITLTE
jgi:glutamine---fructose-6-phosphate transaminase (isomerizing)